MNSAELFDPATNSFSFAGLVGIPRSRHKATRLADGSVLVTGGQQFTGFPSAIELYDAGTGSLRIDGSLNDPRADHTATLLINGQVLIHSTARRRYEKYGVVRRSDPSPGGAE